MTVSSDTKFLFLIRHGATDANEARPAILQGRGVNGGLSPTGQRQAEAVARFLADQPLHSIHCSPLLRARETAERTANRHRLSLQQLSGIEEIHVGRWEGLSWPQVMEQFPDEYASFISDPSINPYAGGESLSDLQARVCPAIDRVVLDQPAGHFAIFAHKMVNSVYLAKLLEMPLSAARRIHQANGGINIVRFRGDETRLVTLNSVAHLEPEDW